mgnify:CR=1 FL=1
MRSNNKLTVFCFFFLIAPNDAFSYFDPGSGSYLIQLFIAFVASCYFFITNPIQSIKNFLNKNKKKNKNEKDKDKPIN